MTLSVAGCDNRSAADRRAVDSASRAIGPGATAIGTRIVFAGAEHHTELALYLQPTVAWSDEDYLLHLTETANLTLALARSHPTYSAEICEDAVYAPHPKGVDFVPAARVVIERGTLDRLPRRVDTAVDVLRLADQKKLQLVLDPRVRLTAAYRDALNASLADPPVEASSRETP